MNQRLAIAAILALTGSGCSLVWSAPNDRLPDAFVPPPDTGLDAGRDSGSDSGLDAGDDVGIDSGDAGMDAGPLPMDAGPPPPEECGNLVDDDRDRLTDCDDPECYPDRLCCMAGQEISGLSAGSWSSLAIQPGGVGGYGPGRFLDGSDVTYRGCAPVAAGIETTIALGNPIGGLGPLSFGWTRASWADPEVAIRVAGNPARIEVLRAGQPVELTRRSSGERATFVDYRSGWRITWRFTSASAPHQVVATARLFNDADEWNTAEPIVLLDEDLASCSESLGLFVRVQNPNTSPIQDPAADAGVYRSIDTDRLTCRTPGLFGESDGGLGRLPQVLAQLPLSGEGSAGSPALDFDRGWVAVDLVDVDRDRERFMTLNYRVAEAQFSQCGGNDGGVDAAACWSQRDAQPEGRDPEYASSWIVSPGPDMLVQRAEGPVERLQFPGRVITYPIQDGGITLRRIAQVDQVSTEQGTLLREAVFGERSGIIYARSNLQQERPPFSPLTLVDPPGQGPLLARTHPAAILDGDAVRLWVLGTADDGQRGLYLYYGRWIGVVPDAGVDAGVDAGAISRAGLLSEFVAFPGNPVLTSENPALGCVIGSACAIESFTVDRISPSEIVFIVAVAERRAGQPTARRLIPLVQALPSR